MAVRGKSMLTAHWSFAFSLFANALSFLSNSLWSIVLVRGWVKREVGLQIPLGLILLAVVVPSVDLQTTVGCNCALTAPVVGSLVVASFLIVFAISRDCGTPALVDYRGVIGNR